MVRRLAGKFGDQLTFHCAGKTLQGKTGKTPRFGKTEPGISKASDRLTASSPAQFAGFLSPMGQAGSLL